MRGRVAAAAVLLLLGATIVCAQEDGPLLPPRLVIDAPPGFEWLAGRVEAFDRDRLVNVMRLVGLEQPGPPIIVQLLPESSAEARGHPSWIAGYTTTGSSRVVLFPARAPAYPQDFLEQTLHHEVAHVLTARAAHGRPIPRWFNEGVAMAAEHTWGLGDDTRLAVDILWRNPVPVANLDEMFHKGASENQRAYAMSGALVHDLLDRVGPSAVADVLALVAQGRRFNAAFSDVAGESADQAAAMLWQRRSAWVRWMPLLGSTAVLWMGVTMLALYAIRRRRAQSAALRKRWERDEQHDDSDRHDIDLTRNEKGR
jgi:hypothetical protein